MKILTIGDVVGEAGIDALHGLLAGLRNAGGGCSGILGRLRRSGGSGFRCLAVGFLLFDPLFLGALIAVFHGNGIGAVRPDFLYFSHILPPKHRRRYRAV